MFPTQKNCLIIGTLAKYLNSTESEIGCVKEPVKKHKNKNILRKKKSLYAISLCYAGILHINFSHSCVFLLFTILITTQLFISFA